MALKKSTQLTVKGNFSIDVPNAYIKVCEVSGTKELCSAFVYWFKDEKEQDAFEGRQYNFVPDMNGGNFIAQAYKHLKTLPEFDGAQDC